MKQIAPLNGPVDEVTAQAVDWILELQSLDLDVNRIVAWQQWLSENARHRQEFDRLQLLHEQIGRVSKIPWPTDDEIARDPYDVSDLHETSYMREASDSHESFRRREEQQQPEHSLPGAKARRRSIAAAASVALAVALIGYSVRNFAILRPAPAAIETQRGELRRVPLADGSVITLDGGTRVTIDLEPRVRHVVLERGQAFFEVAKDAHRPFVVLASGTAITAVGTAFDVRRVGDDVTVGVAEGAVKVEQSMDLRAQPGAVSAPSALTAGHLLRIDRKRPGFPLALSTDQIATWRDGRHQYIAEPLVDIVADLNRYFGRPVSVPDAQSGQLIVSGVVFERDVERWLKSLETALPVTIREESNGSISILPRM